MLVLAESENRQSALPAETTLARGTIVDPALLVLCRESCVDLHIADLRALAH